MRVLLINVAQLLCVFLQPVSIKGTKLGAETKNPTKQKIMAQKAFKFRKRQLFKETKNQSENGLVFFCCHKNCINKYSHAFK